MRVTVDVMREHSLNPTRRECVVVAKAITQKYPNSFLDKNEEGGLIGCGYFSILNQLKTRVEYLNRDNPLSCLRKHKRTQRDDEDGDDQPAPETSASLEEKKLEMLDIFSREGLKGTERGRVEDLMAITYAKQREYINAKPSPSILDSDYKVEEGSKSCSEEQKDCEGTDGLAVKLVMLAHFKKQEESPFLIADFDAMGFRPGILFEGTFMLLVVEHFFIDRPHTIIHMVQASVSILL
ncbi:unnamed protein product [Leuciscus chuanchicus]